MITMSFFFGHSLFEFWHVLYLSISIILIVIGSILAIKHISLKTMQKIGMIGGIISESVKAVAYIVHDFQYNHGYLSKTNLPFNLCNIQIIFFIILVVSNNEKIKNALRCFMLPTCLVGGTAALFIATSSSLNIWPISIAYFGYHVVLIVFAIYLLASKEMHFTVKDYGRTIVMLFAMFLFAIYINSILAQYNVIDGRLANDYAKINYMYVVMGPSDNEIPFLNSSHGWIVYIVHYSLLSIFAVTCCYIKPIIAAIKT